VELNSVENIIPYGLSESQKIEEYFKKGKPRCELDHRRYVLISKRTERHYNSKMEKEIRRGTWFWSTSWEIINATKFQPKKNQKKYIPFDEVKSLQIEQGWMQYLQEGEKAAIFDLIGQKGVSESKINFRDMINHDNEFCDWERFIFRGYPLSQKSSDIIELSNEITTHEQEDE